MATLLQTNKDIISFTKSLTKFYNEYFGSDDPDKSKMALDLHDFFERIHRIMHPEIAGQNTLMEPPGIEAFLFEKISHDNIDSFRLAYTDLDEKMQARCNKLEVEAEKLINKLPKLDNLALPVNAHGVGMLKAQLHSINRGLNNTNDLVVKELYKLENKIAAHSVLMHPDMPKEQSVQDYMLAALKTHRNGDDQFAIESAMQQTIEALQASPKFEGGKVRRVIFESELFADLAKQVLEEDKTIKFISTSSKTDHELSNLENLSGIHVRIASDIPDCTQRDALLTGKLMHLIADRIRSTPNTMLEHYGTVPASKDDVMVIRQKVERMKDTYMNMLAHQLEGFKRQWEADKVFEDSLSLT